MGRETTELIITVAGMMLGVILVIRAILSLFISKEKLKRFHRALRRAFTIVVIPGSLSCIALSIAKEGDLLGFNFWTFFFGNEFVCYSIISMAYLTTFYVIAKKIKLPLKIVFSVIGAALFTAEVFFVNNILHTMRFWGMFRFQGFSFHEDFWPFVKNDLKYSLGLGIFRYILVFLFQLIAFGIVSAFADPKVRTSLKRKADNTKRILFIKTSIFFGNSNLARLTNAYCHDLIEFRAISDYLNEAKNDERFMYELIHCIKKYQIPKYSFVLFRRYKRQLTKNQYIDQRAFFLEHSNLALPVDCCELDMEYGLDREGVIYVDYDLMLGRKGDKNVEAE